MPGSGYMLQRMTGVVTSSRKVGKSMIAAARNTIAISRIISPHWGGGAT